MDFYGTIGPACADVKLLQQMVEAGMTGIRIFPGTELHRQAIAEGVVTAETSLLEPQLWQKRVGPMTNLQTN